MKYVVILLLFTLTGCGLLGPQSYDVTITSNPPGARIFINQQDMGKTPTVCKIKSTKESMIELTYGNKVKYLRCDVSPNIGTVVIDVIVGVVPAVIDFVTGGWNVLDQNKFHVDFEN